MTLSQTYCSSIKGCGLSLFPTVAEPRTLMLVAQPWPVSDSTTLHAHAHSDFYDELMV